MSVYSGFGTREQETKYNNYLNKIVMLMNKHILWSIREEKFDAEKWKHTFEKLYKHMVVMEKSKYLPPKFSQSVSELAEQLGIVVNETWEKSDAMSRNSSRSLSRTKQRSETMALAAKGKLSNSEKKETARSISAQKTHIRIFSQNNGASHIIVDSSKTPHLSNPNRFLSTNTTNTPSAQGTFYGTRLARPDYLFSKESNLLQMKITTPKFKKQDAKTGAEIRRNLKIEEIENENDMSALERKLNMETTKDKRNAGDLSYFVPILNERPNAHNRMAYSHYHKKSNSNKSSDVKRANETIDDGEELTLTQINKDPGDNRGSRFVATPSSMHSENNRTIDKKSSKRGDTEQDRPVLTDEFDPKMSTFDTAAMNHSQLLIENMENALLKSHNIPGGINILNINNNTISVINHAH